MDWRLLVKERNIGIPLNIFCTVTRIFQNQPTVNNGGVSRDRVCAYGCWLLLVLTGYIGVQTGFNCVRTGYIGVLTGYKSCTVHAVIASSHAEVVPSVGP